MSEHAISALREKRAEVAGQIDDLEKQARSNRAMLAHIDEVLRLLDPSIPALAIPPKHVYRRTGYFAHGELAMRCSYIIRENAGKPITSRAISERIIADKGLPSGDAALTDYLLKYVLKALARMQRRGLIVKSGTGRYTQWAATIDSDP